MQGVPVAFLAAAHARFQADGYSHNLLLLELDVPRGAERGGCRCQAMRTRLSATATAASTITDSPQANTSTRVILSFGSLLSQRNTAGPKLVSPVRLSPALELSCRRFLDRRIVFVLLEPLGMFGGVAARKSRMAWNGRLEVVIWCYPGAAPSMTRFRFALNAGQPTPAVVYTS